MLASVRLARTIRLAIVGSAARNPRAISSVVRPPSSRRVSAILASVDSTGWQEMNISRSRSSSIFPVVQHGVELGGSAVLRRFQFAAEQVQLAAEPFVPADLVDGPVLGGEHEPGAGVGRDALGRPLLQRGDEGVLRQFLRQADVPDQPGQAGDDPGRLEPPHRLDRAMRRRVRSVVRGH